MDGLTRVCTYYYYYAQANALMRAGRKVEAHEASRHAVPNREVGFVPSFARLVDEATTTGGHTTNGRQLIGSELCETRPSVLALPFSSLELLTQDARPWASAQMSDRVAVQIPWPREISCNLIFGQS